MEFCSNDVESRTFKFRFSWKRPYGISRELPLSSGKLVTLDTRTVEEREHTLPALTGAALIRALRN